jgi:repressor LexA
MTEPKLTKRQSEILDLIVTCMETTGSPPTRAEIAKQMGFRSPNAAEDHLRALAKKGFLELVPGTSRGIRLLRSFGGIPLVGRVAAGAPILAQGNIERNYNIDKSLFNHNVDYLLKVCGDSMQDIGILDGDLLAVQSCKQATTGQIVVARINDEVTVKRFYQEDNVVTLKPENNAYEPIKVDLSYQDLAIEGIGIGVVRNL